MTAKEQIQYLIDSNSQNKGHVGTTLQPTLRFGLTNYENNNSFKVESIDEAENIVISFISYAIKGEIFSNNIYDENKDLFLNVHIIPHK